MVLKIFLSIILSVILSLQPLFANISPVYEKPSVFQEVFSSGTVTGGADLGGSKRIIWIQDLHSNPQVQKNITALVEEIAAKTALTGVYGEGFAAGKADVSVLASIPKAENKAHSIQYLYDNGFLSAAEYIALKGEIEVFGVEDKNVYAENLRLLEEITREKKQKAKKISDLEQALTRLNSAYLSKEVLKYGVKTEKGLYKSVYKNGDIPYYPNLSKYSQYVVRGSSLSSGKINKELNLCLAELKEKMSYTEYSSVLNSLSSGNERVFADLYAVLSRGYPELLKKYGEFALFLENRNTLSGINNVSLVYEEALYADGEAQARTAGNTDSELLELGQAVKLLASFFNAAVNASDYDRLQAGRERFEVLFNKYFDGENRAFAVSLLNDAKRKKFYENNVLRDKLFVKEMLKAPAAGGDKECKVIIAGGFHYGLAEEFEKAGISYLIVTPSVNGARDESRYDDFILYGAQTLNKLFHADFDFGSADKVLNGFFSVISAWGGYELSAQMLQQDIDDWIKSCKKIGGMKVSVTGTENGYTVKASYKGKTVQKTIAQNKGDQTPPALGKRIESLAATLLNLDISAIPRALCYKALVQFGFRGVNGEFLRDPEFMKRDERSFLKKIQNIASAKLGKSVQVKISSNPALIANSTDWALATLAMEDGNYSLYLHEALLGDLLFYNLPENYSVSKFFSELVRHEKMEFDALNNEESEIAAEFAEYLAGSGEVLNSKNFHKFLAVTERELSVLNIASKMINEIMSLRTDRSQTEMFDPSFEYAKRAFLAQNADDDFDFREKEPAAAEKPAAVSVTRKKPAELFEQADLAPVENEAGILLVSKAAAYFRAVDKLITYLSDSADVSETIDVMTDTYDASWVKLAVLRELSEGMKIIATNIHTPGNLIWTDALMEDGSGKRVFLHTNHIFFHEASEASKTEEGLRRFGSGSVVNALSLIAQAQQLIVAKGEERSKLLDEALVILMDEDTTTAKKKSLALKQLRKYAKNVDFNTANGTVSLIADASQELRRDYFEAMIEFVNSPEGKRQYGRVDSHIFVIDTRGIPAIKERIIQRKAEIEREYGDKYMILFADEIVDTGKSIKEKIAELNEWSYEYADDFDEDNLDGREGSPGKILYGTVYSRYVGLLLELVTLAELSRDNEYEILQSGHEIKDENGKYVTELDVVARDKDGLISIIECKSARSKMPYNDILKSKVIYKLDTYLKYRDVINADLGEGNEFRQVIFVMDTGGKKSLEQRLRSEEEKLGALYGFPVKFIFTESNPRAVKEITSKQPKTLSLLGPFMKTRTQTFIVSMLSPLWEALLWIPAVTLLGGGMAVAPIVITAAVVIYAALHNLTAWAALKLEGKNYGLKSFVKDFFTYLRRSSWVGAGTAAAYFAAFFFTGSHVLASFAAFSANIIVHYMIQQYILGKTAVKHDTRYFDKLKDRSRGIREQNMIEALKEAEHGRGKHSEMSTFLKPAVGAFIADENGNKGRGYNGKGSLLHAEYFSVISYLQNYIDSHESGEKGYTEKGRRLTALLNAVLLNGETLNRRVFEKNPRLLKMAGFEVIYPKKRTIDDVFNETNLIFKYIDAQLGYPLADASLYCTLAPCNKCSKMMAFIGIKELLYASYSINSSHKGTDILESAGVQVTGGVLADEADEYIANYKVANASPGRTKVASFFQKVSRTISGVLDLASRKRYVNFNDIYRSPVNVARSVYEKSAGMPSDVVIRIADSGNYHELLESEDYSSERVRPLIFADYGFEYDHSDTVNFSPIFTVKRPGASVLFETYFDATKASGVFYIKVIGYEGVNEKTAYQIAYAQFLKELKEGVMDPSLNGNVKSVLGTGSVNIVGVEADFREIPRYLYEETEDLYDIPAEGYGIRQRVAMYRFFAQMKKDAEVLRAEGRETETGENRILLSGKSVSVNVASLGNSGLPGKFTDIPLFASAVKDVFRSINISAYMPLKKGEWADDIFINWIEEAERTGNADIAGRIKAFYSANLNREFDLKYAEEILAFEKSAAAELLVRQKNKTPGEISPSELKEYYEEVKARQMKEAVEKAKQLGTAINSYYIYDESVSAKENTEKTGAILKLFDGIVAEIETEKALEFAGEVNEFTEGKAVLFKMGETDEKKLDRTDSELKNRFGFRALKEYGGSGSSYGKVVSVPVEKINDSVLEKLNNSSAVIVEVPESSANVVENVSAVKNGESLISRLKNTAKKITFRSPEKTLQDYYLNGYDIASRPSVKVEFGANITVNGITGRGLLASMKALDDAKTDYNDMSAVFLNVRETAAASTDADTASKISVIVNKIEKQYLSSESAEEKRVHAESLQKFIYGLYFASEINGLPALQKYGGAYAQRAADYAADIRKDIVNAQNGMKIEGDLRAALRSLYMLVSADMITKNELLAMCEYYLQETQKGSPEELFMFAAVLGQAAKKYGKNDFLKYSGKIKEKVITHKTAGRDFWAHIAALASIAYLENDGSARAAVREIAGREDLAAHYEFEQMVAAVSLTELLGYDGNTVKFFNTEKATVKELIIKNHEIAGVYAKLFKLRSESLSAAEVEKELKLLLEEFSISSVKRYSRSGDKSRSASMAMALTELCELAGMKNDFKDMKETFKQSSVTAVKSILSAA